MYGYLENGKKYIPQVLSSECGKVKMQNHRKTYTNIPTIFHNFEDEKTEFGVYFMIFRSKSIIEPYPGPSAQFRTAIEKVGLKCGFNEKHNCFITTSDNGWNQEYHIDDQIEHIASQGEGTIMQFDGWLYFCDYYKWILPLLLNQVMPSKYNPTSIFFTYFLYLGLFTTT